MVRLLWLIIGWLAAGLGAIGAFLPVLPTVPFLIVAVWAFSRSSPHLRDRILNHPQFGPPIRDWRERGTIPRKAKLWSTVAMGMGVLWSLILGVPGGIVIAQGVVCTLVAAYLLSRPES